MNKDKGKRFKKLQYIYDQEVNVGIQCVWDAGYRIWLGLDLPPHQKAIRPDWGYCDTFEEAVDGLIELFEKHHGRIK